MKLFVKVKPGAKTSKFKKIDGTHFEVWVKEPPQKGRANEALLKVISANLGIPRSAMSIVSGLKSHRKVIEVNPLR